MSAAAIKIVTDATDDAHARSRSPGGAAHRRGAAVRLDAAPERRGAEGPAARGHRHRCRAERPVAIYAGRGVNLVRVAGRWAFRTAGDLSFVLARDVVEQKKLSRAAMETLAIVAYHQPVTRAEIEEIRGVATSKGTLDTLLETGWIRLRGRQACAGPARHLRHDARLPRAFRPRSRSTTCLASRS